MTTTVYDYNRRILASDSRWSAVCNLSDGQHLIFADDTGFHKIALRPGASLILAGDGQLISEWKKWWQQETISSQNMPEVALSEIRLVSVMLIANDGDILFDAGPKLILVDTETQGYVGIFSGSGKDYAAECFDVNRCFNTAVETAKAMDVCSGGKVMFSDISNGQNNLHDENYDYNSVITAIHDRGMIMKLNNDKIPANDPVATELSAHPEAETLKKALKSGSIRACAPSGDSQFRWTEARVDRLKNAIDRVAAIEASMRK
ncbi:hypothetical protein GJO14_05945 [Escherichia coli]|nr:hypothetical protein [Escherichia coli]